MIMAAFGIIQAQNQTQPAAETEAERAARLHQSSIVCDLHADSLTIVKRKHANFARGSSALQIDLPKLKAGNISLATLAIWIPDKMKYANFKYADLLISLFGGILKEAPDLRLVRGFGEFEAARKDGKIAIVLTIEDGRAIEGKIENLRALYERGIRGMSLTWNINNDLATGVWEARRRKGQGLTGKGREVVREMAKMGMMIDISHASPETVRDILKVVTGPIYASHACVYAINPHWRNLRDWEIQEVARRGGVIGVNFFSKHLRKDGKTASPADVVKHIDYIVKLVGVDYVAIGSDYDGDIKNIKGLENISKMEALTEALVRKGYSEENIRKILGGNFLRYFKTVCP